MDTVLAIEMKRTRAERSPEKPPGRGGAGDEDEEEMGPSEPKRARETPPTEDDPLSMEIEPGPMGDGALVLPILSTQEEVDAIDSGFDRPAFDLSPDLITLRVVGTGTQRAFPSNVADALSRNTTLIGLTVDRVYYWSKDEAEGLATMLRNTVALRHLTLNRTEMRIPSANEALARGLAANRSLITLAISSIYAGPPIVHGDPPAPPAENVVLGAMADHPTIEIIIFTHGMHYSPGAVFEPLLTRATTLRRLDLTETFIGWKGVDSLAAGLRGNTTLTHLILRMCHLSGENTKRIAEALVTNTGLLYLDISTNLIGEWGGPAFATLLASNNTLQYLNLRNTNIGDGTVSKIAKALATNTGLRHLDLRRNETISTLESLQLLANVLITENRTLTYLGVTSGFADYDSNYDRIVKKMFAVALQRRADRREAEFMRYAVVPFNILSRTRDDSYLATLPPELADEVLQWLKPTPRTDPVQIEAPFPPTTTTNAPPLLMPIEMKRTRAERSPEKPPAGGTDDDDEEEEEMDPSESKRAREAPLPLLSTAEDVVAAANRGELFVLDPRIRTLNLYGHELDFVGVNTLATVLKTNQTLQHLDLHQTSIEDDAAVFLADALKTNQTLQHLNLASNIIGDKGIAALANALKTNQTLQRLYLQDNGIENAGANALARALKTNQILQHLDLRDNKIGKVGGVSLARALTKNQTLQHLDLRDNEIDNDGAVALANALKTNQTLQHLNLNNNGIGDKGAVALADALKTNQTLQHLDLRKNLITIEAARALLAVITTTNLALKYVGLTNRRDITASMARDWTEELHKAREPRRQRAFRSVFGPRLHWYGRRNPESPLALLSPDILEEVVKQVPTQPDPLRIGAPVFNTDSRPLAIEMKRTRAERSPELAEEILQYAQPPQPDPLQIEAPAIFGHFPA